MRKNLAIAGLVVWAVLVFVGASAAHFGMIIPSKDVVGKDDKKEISLTLQFTHPFQGGPQMQMDKPEKFGVVLGETVTHILGTLNEKKVEGKSTWEANYKITKPGDYIFFVQPKPYWEPAEDKFIVHITKVIVDALGAQEGWDKPIAKEAGLPVEIVPLSRPYSLYAGNVFTGQVFKDGKPMPDTNVEVELWGKGNTKAPTEAHVAQVLKTDANGIFSFAMPKAGWWGFSAITEGAEPIKYEVKDKKVEIGAVLRVQAYPMK